MKRTLSIPVVVLIAVVALVLGTFGSATAAGITKGQVKKIAAKVVSKKASSLSVAKATTADTATKAATADNATSLGGLPASVYQDRVAHASLTAGVPLAAISDGTPIATVSLNVPSGVNFISIAGAASYAGGSTIQSIWWDVDGTCDDVGSATSGYDVRAWVDTAGTGGSNVGTAALHKVLKVAPGTHSIKLCGRTNAATTVDAADLTVETVANGSTGGSTLRAPAGYAQPAAPDGY